MNKNIGKYPNISELIVSDNTRILSLSDIHGDIGPFKVAIALTAITLVMILDLVTTKQAGHQTRI
jgi:hypothetical protein